LKKEEKTAGDHRSAKSTLCLLTILTCHKKKSSVLSRQLNLFVSLWTLAAGMIETTKKSLGSVLLTLYFALPWDHLEVVVLLSPSACKDILTL
jgi:hypothetical protein